MGICDELGGLVAPDPGIESAGAAASDVGFRADRQHRYPVLHLAKTREHRAADAQGRRILRTKLGVLMLDLRKTCEKSVVLGIRQLRRIEHVVEMRVPIQLLTQRCHFVGQIHVDHG